MKNHLFIGLGGQGGRSLAELRKVFEQRHRDVAGLAQQGFKYDFLSIDSSEDIWKEGKAWKYFGKDVALTDRQKLPLGRLAHASGLAIRPDIAPWIGETSVVDGYLAKNAQIPGANQRRRFGRLLFANNADQIRSGFRKMVGDLTESSANQCWIHVFASLAGGTGSGGILDLVTSLRSEFQNGDTDRGFPIFLYLYVSHDETGGADATYFYQNQYATLRDLNALLCGRLRPNLLGAQHGGVLFDQGDPITQVTLFSSINSRNFRQPISNQIRIASEACFERIYSYLSGQLNANCQKAITGEDILAAFPGEPVRRPERSYRFSGSGMRRWEVPSEKISEALSLDLAVSAMNQMLYQNWQDATGFTDVAVDLSSARLQNVKAPITQLIAKKLLSSSKDSHLAELRRQLGLLEKGVLNATGEQGDLDALEANYDEFFNGSFLGAGLDSYLTGWAANRRAVVRDLVSEIDAFLTRAWSGAVEPVGLSQTPQILNSIADSIRAQVADDQNGQAQRNRLSARRSARKLEWAKLTKLSIMAGKRAALVKAHAADYKHELEYLLSDAFLAQDIEFLKDFSADLHRLGSAYSTAVTAINQIKLEALSERDEILTELRAMTNLDGANRYEFDLRAVERFQEALRTNHVQQDQAAFVIRSKVVPDGMKLSRFQDDKIRETSAVSLEKIENDIKQAAMEKIHAIHQDFVSSGLIGPVLNASLLENLENRFTGNRAALLQEARDFVAMASSSLLIDQAALQPASLFGGQVGVPAMPKRVMVLGIPRHRFADEIKEAFEQAIPPGSGYIKDVYTHDDPTQLRLLVIDYWMAARFSTTVNELATKFAAAATQNATNDLLYFSNIDQDGEHGRRPDLFLPSPQALKLKLKAQLWIGERLSTPIVLNDENGVFLLNAGPNGVDDRLGDNIEAVILTSSIPLMMNVNSLVGEATSSLTAPEKSKLLDVVEQQDATVAEAHRRTSPEYQRWLELKSQITSLLN